MSEKITVDRKLFVDMLKRAQAVVNSGSTLPILGTVQLQAKSGLLQIDAFSFDVSVHLTMPARSQTRWKICVPPRLLAEVVSQMKTAEIDLARNATVEMLEVSTPRGFATFNGMSSDDFPVDPDPGKLSRKKEIPADVFGETIGTLPYAADANAYTSWLANVVDSGISFTTDGHRAAVNGGMLNAEDYAVPAPVAKKLPGLLGLADVSTVAVRKSEQYLRFTTPDADVLVMLPDTVGYGAAEKTLRKYVDAESTACVVVARQQFMRLLDAQHGFGQIYAQEMRTRRGGKPEVYVSVIVADDTLTIRPYRASDFGLDNHEVVGSMDVDGGPLDVLVSLAYLRDAVSRIEAELVEIHDLQNSPNTPLRISAAGGGGVQHIVMPLKREKKEAEADAVPA